MKRIALLCALLPVFCNSVQAQPSIQRSYGVVNASSGLPDVARGSWFVVYGSNLGPPAIVIQGGPPYPFTLSGTMVTFTPAAGGTPVRALLYYTLATQVAAMLPSSTPAGAYDVTVSYNQQTSNAVRINVVERNFGFATQSSNGQGPAQATYGGYDLNRFTSGTLSPWSLHPAHPGDAMVLWGTGLGADAASDTTGGTSGDQTSAGQVKVIVGGTAVTPGYAGRSGGSPGLDQINFNVPATVTPSCFVSLQVSAGGRLSNLGSIAVAAAGQSACVSPGITQAQLQKLDQGGSLTAGGLQLAKSNIAFTSSLSARTDTASGWFGKYTIDTVSNSNLALSQSGACFLVQRSGTIDQMGFGTLSARAMDAGTQLRLNGPGAPNNAIPRQTDQSYLVTLYSSGLAGIGAVGSATLSSGTYTLSGTGGSDIGAFSASVTLPADFTWTNQSSIPANLSRSSPLTVNWSGAAGSLIHVMGASLTRLSGSGLSATFSALAFNCSAPASAGTLTVPASILQQLSAVSNDPTSDYFGLISVFAAPDMSAGQGTFTAPLTAGGSIDVGVIGYEVAQTKIVGFN